MLQVSVGTLGSFDTFAAILTKVGYAIFRKLVTCEVKGEVI